MMSEENLDTKAFTNTGWIGAKSVAPTFSLRSNSFLNPFGRNTFVMKSSQFMVLG